MTLSGPRESLVLLFIKPLGMLVDEKLFEMHEIIQLLEDPEELRERVKEGLDLIKEEAEEGQ
jgi:hypothetical protein